MRTKKTTSELFWGWVDKSGDCWIWMGYRDRKGYGQVRVNGKTFYSHRMAWILSVGYIPKGMCVLHHCDNPKCVNPNHLFIGTHADNMHDMIKKGRHARGYKKKYLNSAAKLILEQAKKIRSLAGKKSQGALAKIFGVAESTIEHIINGETYKEYLIERT